MPLRRTVGSLIQGQACETLPAGQAVRRNNPLFSERAGAFSTRRRYLRVGWAALLQ